MRRTPHPRSPRVRLGRARTLATAFTLVAGVCSGSGATSQAGDGDQLRPDALLQAHHHHHHGGDHQPHRHRDRRRHRDEDERAPEPQGIPGVDSLANFDVSFDATGFASDGTARSTWIMNMVGGAPERGGTTVIEAPIVPVSIDLLDADGLLRVENGVPLHSDVTPFVDPTLHSPVFQRASYSSSRHPTQFGDAIQRAQFFNVAPHDWHTWLAPVVRPTRTLAIPFGFYQFALNADGSCCAFITVESQVFDHLLFPADPADVTTPIGAAENAGDMTPRDLTTILLPNTYLYTDTRTNCCILGFHSYDLEPGDAGNGDRERRFVVAVATWISPGRLAGVEDVSALSHEIAETINDPFVGTDGVHNFTPWWQSPVGNCQNKNEIGDVVEGIAGAVFPMEMPEMTYHLQNQALLPWFRPGIASDAIDGAYSYPDESLLVSPTALLPPFCQ